MLWMRYISWIVVVAGIRESLHAHRRTYVAHGLHIVKNLRIVRRLHVVRILHITIWKHVGTRLYNAGERHHIAGGLGTVAKFMNVHAKETGTGQPIYFSID